MGTAKLNRHFLRPHLKDRYPAGIDPKKAPKFINDPTHDTSSRVSCLIPPRSIAFPLCNFGVAGEDQPPTQPELNEIMEAVKGFNFIQRWIFKLRFFGSTNFLDDIYPKKRPSIVSTPVLCELHVFLVAVEFHWVNFRSCLNTFPCFVFLFFRIIWRWERNGDVISRLST